ncbi:MAG: Uma2 family endonuclease [Oscillospiraceae bacterium]|jgi:Uma2 family endonuclease|nr:Uma2 family endonuclease [Oscillospiraceae bacterium]
MALPAEKERYTFADCLTWREDERIEIIDGEPVMMAPPPSSEHQEISMELSAQLHAYLRGKRCKVYAAPFAVRLFEKDGDRPDDVDTMVEPDISVVCDPNKIDRHGCKGAPDMVVEILSPSTQRHDRFTKFSLYQRAGVKEYWIVDPESKAAQSFVLEDGRYSVKEYGTTGDKMRVSVLEDCVIDLSEVFPS